MSMLKQNINLHLDEKKYGEFDLQIFVKVVTDV